MYKCTCCGETFDEPRHYVESHGFGNLYAEHWSCCPYCGGDYEDYDPDEEVDNE